jgi:hypothetical protein
MFGFSIFWTYLWFSQFMLIWCKIFTWKLLILSILEGMEWHRLPFWVVEQNICTVCVNIVVMNRYCFLRIVARRTRAAGARWRAALHISLVSVLLLDGVANEPALC